MAQTKSRILDFYASKSWAILEANLQEMYGIYKSALERKALDLDFNPEAVAAKIGRPLDNTRTVTQRDGIAILPVAGPVFRYANLFTEISGATSIEVLATDFQQALDDRAVKAIVLEINSPGGEVDGTSELAQHIFEARGQKPIIAYVSHLGASAAYWLASACDEVVCNDTASLGSIGVVGTACIHKDKSHVEFVSSQSPNKRPDPQSESGRSQIQSHVDALADVFIATVARNRGMSADDVINQGGAGGIKVGQHAVNAGLADRVGTLESVLADLSNPENVNQKPVLKLGADSETQPIGVTDMPDKTEEKTNVVDSNEASAVTDLLEAKALAGKVDNAAELEAAKTEAAETARKLAASEAEKSELARQVEALGTNVAELQKQARTARFADLSKGWIGEKATHVAMLELLSANGGEDSELFKGYVTQQKAAAEQVETSNLLKELGSSQAAEGSAEAEIEARAIKMVAESDGRLTKQQAYDQIYSTDASLRARVDAEARVN